MSLPIILALDDEPQVLGAVNRDLRSHFGGRYRVMTAGSGTEALKAITAAKQRGREVALFLVDQRMPEMSGTEFLLQARQVFPDARKVLLTAYADSEAAITSINKVELDHYLMKPWDPPDQNLYPVLDDLLDDWHALSLAPYEGIRIAGTLWSSTSHEVKDMLARNRIPYQWLDLDTSSEARTMVEASGQGEATLPVVFFPDGDVLANPSAKDLAQKAGLTTEATTQFYDLVIIGGGPAGLGAAVYGASEGLTTALIEREATGGQAGTSSRIENYLGFPKGLSGADLARRAEAQARRLGAEVLIAQKAESIRVDDPYHVVTLADGQELTCRALVIASGVSVKRLDAPGVERLTGAGIYYGAAGSEAAYYKDRPMVVVGGANSAGQAAMFLSRYASNVKMLVRGGSLEAAMSDYLVKQIGANEKIDVHLHTQLVEAKGDKGLESIVVEDTEAGQQLELPAAAMFLLIGAVPHTEFVGDAVETNHGNFILTGPDLTREGKRPKGWRINRDPYLLETNVPGIFAAGDVRQGAVRRVATAVGEGAVVVSLVHQYLRSV